MIDIFEVHVTPYDEDRRVHVYVPDDIQPEERFPVLYMFDGHNLFDDEWATYGKSWGIRDYFDSHNVRMLVVGLECNHEGNKRLSEFSPYDWPEKYGYEPASGKILFQWMTTELKQTIDEMYPTLPSREHTFIGGSSMGGIMALYGVIAHNDIYSASVAISPHTSFCMREVLRDCRRKLDPNTRIYLSWGSDESPNKQALARWTNNNLRIVRALTEKVVIFPQFIVGGSHCEACWEKEIPLFMKALKFDKYCAK